MVLEGPHLSLKVHVEDAVCLVHHQELERAQGEALGVLHVVDQTARGRCTRTTTHHTVQKHTFCTSIHTIRQVET